MSRFVIVVFEDIVEDCQAAMLLDNMDQEGWLCMLSKWKSASLREEFMKAKSLRMWIWLVVARVEAHMESKTSLCLREIQVILLFQEIRMPKWTNFSPERAMVGMSSENANLVVNVDNLIEVNVY